MKDNSTIAAISTAPGMGAIAVIRLSGRDSISICDQIFHSPSLKKLASQPANTLHFGILKDGDDIIDEVVVSIFKAPNSYTGENVVEISCHGSPFIQQKILETLVLKGARLARPGEFTLRAFLNGKMDLSQAEAVADLISSTSKSIHKVAINQMRGGFTTEIKKLRERLLHFVSLIELELDFSEEDVEFADRNELKKLVVEIEQIIKKLRDSFSFGNAIKNGIPVAIAGKTNTGKSTLLNLLLKEDRAIVSDIAGTTRDFIEDTITIDGINFRFIDTAGLRHTSDTIEKIGIERTYKKIEQAEIVLLVVDATEPPESVINSIQLIIKEVRKKKEKLVVILNKIDCCAPEEIKAFTGLLKDKLGDTGKLVAMSAKKGENLNELEKVLKELVYSKNIEQSEVIVINVRHYEALSKSHEAILRVSEGLNNQIAGDLIAQDIREALHYLGEITGEITTDEILGNIFKNFCIGK
jgi:tRNA modification GTPase